MSLLFKTGNKMNTEMISDRLELRVRQFVDGRLFKVFWDGVAHFGTKDLVVFFDESVKVDPVSILPRERVAGDPNIPARLQAKLKKPAVDAATMLTASDTAFWLIVHFCDGQSAVVAVNAKPIAPGGNA